MKNRILLFCLLMVAAAFTATAQPRPTAQPTNDTYNFQEWCPDQPTTVTWSSQMGIETFSLPRPVALWRLEVTDKITINAYDCDGKLLGSTTRRYKRLTMDWTQCATPYSLRIDDGLCFFGSRD